MAITLSGARTFCQIVSMRSSSETPAWCSARGSEKKIGIDIEFPGHSNQFVAVDGIGAAGRLLGLQLDGPPQDAVRLVDRDRFLAGQPVDSSGDLFGPLLRRFESLRHGIPSMARARRPAGQIWEIERMAVLGPYLGAWILPALRSRTTLSALASIGLEQLEHALVVGPGFLRQCPGDGIGQVVVAHRHRVGVSQGRAHD